MKKILLICLLGLSFGLKAQNFELYINGQRVTDSSTVTFTYATDPDEMLHAYSIIKNVGTESIRITGTRNVDALPDTLKDRTLWCIMGGCQGATARALQDLEPGGMFAGETEYFGIMPQGYVGEVRVTYTLTTEEHPETDAMTFDVVWDLREAPANRMNMYLEGKKIEDGHMYEHEFTLTDDPDEMFEIHTVFENPGKDTVIIYAYKNSFVAEGVSDAWCMLGNCWGETIEAERYPLLPESKIESEGDDQHYLDYTPNNYVGVGYVYYTFYDKNNSANCLNFAVAWKTKAKGLTANETADLVKTAVYPNPASTTARLSWEAVEGAVVLNIRSVSGQLLYSRSVEGMAEAEINVAGFTPGMYFYTLERQGERLGSGKLLVR